MLGKDEDVVFDGKEVCDCLIAVAENPIWFGEMVDIRGEIILQMEESSGRLSSIGGALDTFIACIEGRAFAGLN